MSFCCKTLIDTEQQCAQIEKECLAVPVRWQRLLLRMMRYNLTAVYVPEKEHVVAEALSHHSHLATSHEVTELLEEMETCEDATQHSWSISHTKLD